MTPKLRISLRTPTACALCGITERRHARRWTTDHGWHTWTMPDQALILARMKHRRTDPNRWILSYDLRTTYRKWKQ